VPATLLSHQALVLPLKMRWPRVFSGLALCIGSMAPDLEFIGRMTDDWLYSHTLSAQFWFTIPVTLGLVWIIAALLVPALLPYVREVRWLRLHDLAALQPPSGVRGWTGAAISAWIGGMSHVLLDAITHGNHSGWLVPQFPVLRTMVPHVGGPVPLYDALQCWLTVLLAIASLVMWRLIARKRLLWSWRGLPAVEAIKRSRASGLRLSFACMVAAVEGGVVGHSLHGGSSQATSMKGVAAAVSFGALDFVFLALVVAAVCVRVGIASFGHARLRTDRTTQLRPTSA
jgi:Domain of unknown function (DUF4184)